MGQAVIEEHRIKLLDVVSKITSILRNVEANVDRLLNSFNPINQLPPEILGVIFRLAINANDEDDICDAIPISQTCSLWRKLALDDGTLWSTLNLARLSRYRADLFISRSKSYHITVDCPYSSGLAYDGWEASLISSHLARTKVLTIKVAKQHPWLLTGAASSLRQLDVAIDLDGPKWKDMILPCLFNDATPELRILKLAGFRMHWRTGCWKNLTELDLTLNTFGRSAGDEEDFRASFSESPFLEVLRLHEHQHYGPGRDLSQDLLPFVGPRLPLVHLREVSLILPLPYITHILSAIVLPDNLQRLYLLLTVKGPSTDQFILADLLQPRYIPEALLDKLSHCRAKIPERADPLPYISSILGGRKQGCQYQYTVTHEHANRYAEMIENRYTVTHNRSLMARLQSLDIAIESSWTSRMEGSLIASFVSLLRHAPSITSLSVSWTRYDCDTIMGLLSSLTAIADPHLCENLTELMIEGDTWTFDVFNKVVVLYKHLRCIIPLACVRVVGEVTHEKDVISMLHLLDQMGLRHYTKKCGFGHYDISIQDNITKLDEFWPHKSLRDWARNPKHNYVLGDSDGNNDDLVSSHGGRAQDERNTDSQ